MEEFEDIVCEFKNKLENLSYELLKHKRNMMQIKKKIKLVKKIMDNFNDKIYELDLDEYSDISDDDSQYEFGNITMSKNIFENLSTTPWIPPKKPGLDNSKKII